MHELQTFKNPTFGDIRTLENNGKILFCAKDVATVLGYSNPRDAVSRHCKGVVKHDTPTNGGTQSVSFIPESDLYRLTFNSKLDKAEEFTDWVTSEVLPSIRKHGAYMTEVTINNIISNPEFGIQILTTLKQEQDKRKALELENAKQKQQLLEAKPKLEYADIVLSCQDAVNITQIAKDYGIGGAKLNTILHDLKIQYKQNGQWLLYDPYSKKGYTKSKTNYHEGKDGNYHSSIHTKWTQKGRMFLYEKLKTIGMLPLIEKEAK
jgi:prophage antirepressor-like protein